MELQPRRPRIIPIFVVADLFPRHCRACPGHPRLWFDSRL